ncbi:hypothetical protein C8J56DRAFT_822194 [Mycena floridula]|nr:hypothetical protein C8J56DRAFT_822194 [Mycena floridula]
MAATLQYAPRNDAGPSLHSNGFSQAIMTELDFRDNRYPSISPTTRINQRTVASPDRTSLDRLGESSAPRKTSGPPTTASTERQEYTNNQPSASEQSRSAISYSLPAESPRRVVERYSLEDGPQQRPMSPESEEEDMGQALGTVGSRSGTPQTPRQPITPAEPVALLPSAPRHPSLPAAGIGGTSNSIPAIMPLSASPGYQPPVSSRQRAYPQQPIYINQTAAMTPIISRVPPQPPEEICVECAMRDQDMADVDVTSPGIWERESDAYFEDLKRREAEEEATGIVSSTDPNRPRSKGGMLTEQNLKIWLSVNPREPASRQQTLQSYLKSQRTLLEAEALAHARATQEARQLDNKMRDAYSKLRMSAYDTGATAAPDDVGGLRIKSPISPTLGAHNKSLSRDVTLLENGMIVEHVDVRKEEREARERRRREERRARKSSRSSGIDVTSLMSTQSLIPDGLGLQPYSPYSSPSSARPLSVLTAPVDRSNLPRAQSQASFSDVHSLGSPSPRRSRFLGIGNFRDRWRSQDSLAPSGMSGSMVDMHVALQREAQYGYQPQSAMDFSSARRSQLWTDLEPIESRQSRVSEGKPKKKKKGLAKIWHLVTRSRQEGSGKEDVRSMGTDDDGPLAPPPPLSYLVNRGPGEGGRHASTPSLTSPKLGGMSSGMSLSTIQSSLLPSPVSSRPSGPDFDIEVRKHSGNYEDQDLFNDEDTIGKSQALGMKNVIPMTSEPDIRRRTSQPSPLPNVTNLPTNMMTLREKSLPPLPSDHQLRQSPISTDNRPQTVYTFDTRRAPVGVATAHDFLPPQAPFRNSDTRRQSFGGLTSRPALEAPPKEFGMHYDEFGNSRRSLHLSTMHPPRPVVSPTPTKRKSRFGLSSLLKRSPPAPEPVADNVAHQFPSMRYSGSDVAEDIYATSTSRHSALSAGPRISVTSRKALEELVSQDPEFVAYRYPSSEQRIDLLR